MIWRVTYTKIGSSEELQKDVEADTYFEAYTAIYYLKDTDTVLDVRKLEV